MSPHSWPFTTYRHSQVRCPRAGCWHRHVNQATCTRPGASRCPAGQWEGRLSAHSVMPRRRTATRPAY